MGLTNDCTTPQRDHREQSEKQIAQRGYQSSMFPCSVLLQSPEHQTALKGSWSRVAAAVVYLRFD